MISELRIRHSEAGFSRLLTPPNVQRQERRTAVATYLAALLLGLGLTAYMFPARKIFATDTLAHPLAGIDTAVHAVGQRYFVKDSWHWPPLLIKTLAEPEGTNVAFTDSIPLMALLMKVFRHFLPSGFHSITLWLAICWVAQPVAAVFAFRSAGERRLLPNFCVALIAASMPTLLFRFVHSALSSHFLLLIALGLYFRIVREPKIGTMVAAGALILVALLVNPYIMYMVIATLAAAPITLMVRRNPAWITAAAGIAVGISVAAAVALSFGYAHAIPMSGFGFYSMNLESPFYPSLGFALNRFGGAVDPTGGQYEGYQYLGVGVILLLVIGELSLSGREKLTLLGRHGGLVLACVGLTVFAVSNKVYLGNRLVLDLPAPTWLLQVRCTGRFFWPVAYVAVIVGALVVCRKLPARWSIPILLLLATAQYIESSPTRRVIRRGFRDNWKWAINETELRPLMANHSKLMVWPKFGCGGDHNSVIFSHVFFLASETAIPVNTTYTGRLTSWPTCNLPQFPVTVQPKELWIFVPNFTPEQEMSLVDWRSICRQIGGIVACAQDLRDRTDLPLPKVERLDLGKFESTIINSPGTQFMVSGWASPEPGGTWSEGPTANLVATVAAPYNKPLTFTASAIGMGVHPSTTQRVSISANGVLVATWDVKEGKDSEYTASIPPRATTDQPILIQFHIEHPVSPHDNGMSQDDRKIGLGLAGFRFDEQNPVERSIRGGRK